MRRIAYCLVIFVLTVMISGTGRPLVAQRAAPPLPDVVLTNGYTLHSYAADGTRGALNETLPPGFQVMDVSSGKAYDSTDSQGVTAMAVLIGPQTSIPLPVDRGYEFIGGAFNENHSLVAYSLIDLGFPPSWIIVIFDLRTQQIRQKFTNATIYPNGLQGTPQALLAGGFYLAPQPIGWSSDNTRLYFQTVAPGTDGAPGDYYMFDLSKTGTPDTNGFSPLPKAIALPIPKNLPPYASRQISPDMSKIAYIYHLTPESTPSYAVNLVILVDSTTGKTIQVVHPLPDHELSILAWTPDSHGIVFVAGEHSDLGSMTGATIYHLTDGGQLSANANLISSNKTLIDGLQVCGNTVFYTTLTAPGSVLNSLSLTDMKTAHTNLVSGMGYLRLVGCAS